MNCIPKVLCLTLGAVLSTINFVLVGAIFFFLIFAFIIKCGNHTNEKQNHISISLLFSTLPATAEYFRNLGLQNGLSQPSVLSIAQDGLGRMWFGTQEGINMYDGEQITYVKGEITNADGEKLWIGNYVPFIVHDIDGDIFFIADNNLFGYDIHTSTFKQYTTDNATTALAVYQNEIWYARKILFSLTIADSIPPGRK